MGERRRGFIIRNWEFISGGDDELVLVNVVFVRSGWERDEGGGFGFGLGGGWTDVERSSCAQF